MDRELKLRVEWDEVSQAFLDAKKHRSSDEKGYQKAKAKMSKLRTHWRGIREATGVDTGAARPATIETKAKG